MSDRCERDYKGHHYFEKLGVMMLAVDDYVKEPHLISRCTQCLKCKAERLEFLEE